MPVKSHYGHCFDLEFCRPGCTVWRGRVPAYSDFAFDPDRNHYVCPGGKELRKYHRAFAKPRDGLTKEGTMICFATTRLRAPARLSPSAARKGGVHGRKLNLISLDDGYSAPKTVEQTRRLIEEERVAFIFQTFGGFTNLAIRPYLNERKVPQLFGAAGADQLDDPQHFPWMVGFNPATSTEARIYGKRILATRPDAKIGVIYQNDQLGRSFLTGLRDGLGGEHVGMIVKEVSYEVSDPTVDSQVATLQGSGADTLIIAATSKAASQTIRKAYDIGWMPERYLFFGAASIVGTLKPAGLEKSKGLITAGYLKDATAPRWQDDPGSKNGRLSRRNTCLRRTFARVLRSTDTRWPRRWCMFSSNAAMICRARTFCVRRSTSRTLSCRCCCRASRSTLRPTITPDPTIAARAVQRRSLGTVWRADQRLSRRHLRITKVGRPPRRVACLADDRNDREPQARE